MKVLLPFWNLDLIDRYEPQLLSLANEVDKLIILYTSGGKGKSFDEFMFNTEFIKLPLPNMGQSHLNWWAGRKTAPSFVPSDLDVVYSLSGLWMNLYGQEIADYWDIPHVIRMRGDMSKVRLHQRRSHVERWLFHKTHEECFRKASLVTPIVEKYIPYLKTIGVRDIGEVIPNGVDPRLGMSILPDRFTPGYAGRISKEKGSQFLMELIKSTPQYTWKITGEIQDQDFIPPDNCHYLGKTPFAYMGEFYNEVSCLVIPSFTEGFPNAILEGYINGKPVLGSVDAIPQEAKVFGMRADLDIETWSERLDILQTMWRTTPEKYIELGNRAREYARSFTWKAHGRGIKRQLDKAISLRVKYA